MHQYSTTVVNALKIKIYLVETYFKSDIQHKFRFKPLCPSQEAVEKHEKCTNFGWRQWLCSFNLLQIHEFDLS